jgi:hypothetical protein
LEKSNATQSKSNGQPSADKITLSRLDMLKLALEDALSLVSHFERMIAIESGENTIHASHPPPSNAKQVGDHLKGTGQEPYDLLAQSIIAGHTPFDSTEVRRIWLTIFNDETGRSLCREISEAIKTGEGIESMKPDGDPAEKLKTIQFMQATDPGLFQRMLKEVGAENHINVTFKDVTPKPRNN